MTSQLNLLEWSPKGDTADLARDGKRLGAQLQAVYAYVRESQWTTLHEISAAVGAPEASVSARLRDLRNHFGFTVQREYVARGLHKYRVFRQ